MLFVHGGGWIYGGLRSHDAACRVLAERSGVQLLAIDYRLAPEHPFPAALEDGKAALRWLHEHADEVGADPARLGVAGDSAGGNIAAVLAVHAAEEGIPLAFQLLIYPGTDFTSETRSKDLFSDKGLVLTSTTSSRRRRRATCPTAATGRTRRRRRCCAPTSRPAWRRHTS